MSRLNPQNKDKLVLAAKQVYFAYLNLKNLNSRSNPANKQSENLTAFITALSEKISSGNTRFDLPLGDKKLKVFVDGEKLTLRTVSLSGHVF